MKTIYPHGRIKRLPVWSRILLAFLLIIILLMAIGTVYLNHLINHRLTEIVVKTSNGLYRVDYNKARLNLFTGNLTVYEVRLRADSNVFLQLTKQHQAPRYLVSGEFNEFTIQGLRWLKWFTAKRIQAGEFLISNPKLTVTQYNRGSDTSTQRPRSIQEILAREINGLQLGSFRIKNASVTYELVNIPDKERSVYTFEHLDFDLFQPALAKDNQDSLKKISFANFRVSLKDYKYHTTDGMYLIDFKNFEYDYRQHQARMASLAIQPLLSEEQYSKLPYQQERNNILFNHVSINETDLPRLIETGEIDVQRVNVEGGSWSIYLSRIPPLPPARKDVVPTQKLMKLPVQVAIHELLLQHFDLKYKEFNPLTDKAGLVNFEQVKGRLTNITNNAALVRKNPHLLAELTAKLMGKGAFNADFDFILNDHRGAFSVKASLGEMNGAALNPGFIALNKIEIRSGTINNMKCSGSGNENVASGNVLLLYHGLHINVLKLDKDADTLRKKGLISLVANILVKNDNPKKDEAPRTASNIVVKRDPRKSFFNMLWMVLFNGIVKSVTAK